MSIYCLYINVNSYVVWYNDLCKEMIMEKTQFNIKPRFNLSVVMQETNLKADTLRVWEKRYDLPHPERSKGGHRLYSELDIAIIKWLQSRQKEGMSISRAVKFWHEINKEDGDPFKTFPLITPPSSILYESFSLESFTLDEVRKLWISACLDFDEIKAEGILNQAYAQFSLEATSIQILQKGISIIGDLWYEGKASVQQEHFASELATRKVHSLIGAAPKPIRDKTILIGCPENEIHTFFPLLINLFLRYRGWQVINLGADVPFDNFKATLALTNPDLVFYSAMRFNTASELLTIGNSLYSKSIPFTFGGWIFSQSKQLIKKIPGQYIGTDLLESIKVIEGILDNSIPYHSFEASLNYSETIQHFNKNLKKIEVEVEKLFSDEFEETPFHLHDIRIIHSFFAENIIAGLQFGDLKVIESDLKWVLNYLVNLNIEEIFLKKYFQYYSSVTKKILDGRGEVIKNWLESIL